MSLGRSGRRSDTIGWSITGLENMKSYYVEVELKPLRSDIYYPRQKRPRSFTFKLMFIPKLLSKFAIITTVIIVIVMLLIFLLISAVMYKQRPERQLILIRIKEKDLTLIQPPIGSGITSEVYRATLRPNEQLVAVKRPKDSASEKEKSRLLHEALILQHLKHPNIIKAVGICLDTKPYKLVLDYKPHGNLINYLRHQENITQLTLVRIAIDIAKAGCYLTQEGYLHRDISAKNVLTMLDKQNKFISACLSDVVSLNQQQNGADFHYSQLQQMIRDTDLRPGNGLKPDGCPPEIHQLMKQCWEKLALSRPTFSEVLERLAHIRDHP